jgi:membrane dipeptidase
MTSSDSVSSATEPTLIFDGHNDTLLNLPRTNRTFFDQSEQGHIDLPRARKGGLAGGFFAVFIPDPEQATKELPPAPEAESEAEATGMAALQSIKRYADPANLPPMMPLEHAQRTAMSMVAQLLRIEVESDGQAKIVRTAAELKDAIDNGVFAMELHFEGAEAIDPDFDALEVYHAAGLRSLGLTWSRPNIFASGVPFKFPATPDTGPGLTDLGKDLVRACNRLGIMIDLSHLNEKGFWDVAAISDAPLVATHSNAHALSNSTRNLTDKQLAAIRESDGLVGLNFHCAFLRSDGVADPETPLSVMADQLDYLIEHLGVERVGLGSDFDGALMPREITDAAGLPNLIAVLRERGFDDATLRKIGYENWIRVLGKTWGA